MARSNKSYRMIEHDAGAGELVECRYDGAGDLLSRKPTSVKGKAIARKVVKARRVRVKR